MDITSKLLSKSDYPTDRFFAYPIVMSARGRRKHAGGDRTQTDNGKQAGA